MASNSHTMADSEGLQVAEPPAHLERAVQDSEGLQHYQRYPTGLEKAREESFPEVHDHIDRSGTLEAWHDPLKDNKAVKPRRNRRKWLLVLAILGVVVVLCAVLGGVFGVRAMQSSHSVSGAGQSTQSEPAPPIPSASATTGSPRIRSEKGAWNGTGMSAWFDAGGPSSVVYFQDYTGQIISLGFKVDNTTAKLSANGPAVNLAIGAANNTGLATFPWMQTNPWMIQTIYVDSTGHLADMTQNTMGGPPIKGNLSRLQIPAPTDGRPAMVFIGTSVNNPATKQEPSGYLFVGGIDGQVHEYSYSFNNRTWYSSATNDFPQASAYGAAFTADYAALDNTSYRSLMLSDGAGNLKYYTQQNGLAGDPGWPHGGSWSLPLSPGQQTSRNSSVIPAIDWHGDGDAFLLFPEAANGTLESLHTNWNRSSPQNTHSNGFGATTVLGNGQQHFAMMQGSDMAAVRVHDQTPDPNVYWNMNNRMWNVIFYQDEGSSLAFMVIDDDGTTVLNKGHITFDNGQWGFDQ